MVPALCVGTDFGKGGDSGLYVCQAGKQSWNLYDTVGGLVAKAYKMFPNVHPHIEKYVSDSDEKMTSENRLSTREETYTYTLRTMVPIENEETCYHDLSISDQLDDFLEIKNVTVTNENGVNAEKFWTIQKINAFVARCSDIKNTSFYGHTYDFQITVGVKKRCRS